MKPGASRSKRPYEDIDDCTIDSDNQFGDRFEIFNNLTEQMDTLKCQVNKSFSFLGWLVFGMASSASDALGWNYPHNHWLPTPVILALSRFILDFGSRFSALCRSESKLIRAYMPLARNWRIISNVHSKWFYDRLWIVTFHRGVWLKKIGKFSILCSRKKRTLYNSELWGCISSVWNTSTRLNSVALECDRWTKIMRSVICIKSTETKVTEGPV